MILLVALWSFVAPVCWPPPVVAAVIEPYRAPACTYCVGHRGITYGTVPGSPVVAVDGGVVQFAARVAGVLWVVVRHADGSRASYGYLSTVTVRPDEAVAAGERLGTSSRRVYFGLRRGDEPVDPTPLLGRWVGRVRLVPVTGDDRRPGGVPRLACGTSAPTR